MLRLPARPGRRVLVVLAFLTLVQLGLTSVVRAEGDVCTYVVQRGDTLFSISRRFCTTVAAIAQANCICNPNLIFVGQRLVIPAQCVPACPEVCAPACPAACTHIVQRGETLTGIAARFGSTVFALMRLNGIRNPNLIFVGQCLRIAR
jgi:LysM repeat protein